MSKSQVMAPSDWTPEEIATHRVMLIRSFVALTKNCELNSFDSEHVRCIVDRLKRFPTICTAPEITTWLRTNRLRLMQGAFSSTPTPAGTSGTAPER